MKYLAVIIGLCLFAAPAVISRNEFGKDDEMKEKQAKIQKQHHEISVINLLNGLNLSPKQMQGILYQAKEADKIREEYKAKNGQLLQEAEAALGNLKDDILDGDPGAPPVEAKAMKANHQLKEQKKECMKKLKDLEDDVNKHLTEGQKKIIADFKPCLIPPKSLKSPTRAGQANDNEHEVKALEKIKKLPDAFFERQKDEIISRWIKAREMHLGEMAKDEKEQEKARMAKVLEKARKMNDVDFELNKGDLAKELKGTDERQELVKKLQELNEKRSEGLGRTYRWLLTRPTISILEDQIKRGPKKTAANLENITPAERYEGK